MIDSIGMFFAIEKVMTLEIKLKQILKQLVEINRPVRKSEKSKKAVFLKTGTYNQKEGRKEVRMEQDDKDKYK